LTGHATPRPVHFRQLWTPFFWKLCHLSERYATLWPWPSTFRLSHLSTYVTSSLRRCGYCCRRSTCSGEIFDERWVDSNIER